MIRYLVTYSVILRPDLTNHQSSGQSGNAARVISGGSDKMVFVGLFSRADSQTAAITQA